MDKRIDELTKEGDSELFVYLKPGYALSSPPQHCFGADSKAEVRSTMKRVYKCACDDCASRIV